MRACAGSDAVFVARARGRVRRPRGPLAPALTRALGRLDFIATAIRRRAAPGVPALAAPVLRAAHAARGTGARAPGAPLAPFVHGGALAGAPLGADVTAGSTLAV